MAALHGKFVEIHGFEDAALNGAKGYCTRVGNGMYQVVTLMGDPMLVNESNIREIEPVPPTAGGFDVCWPARQDEEGLSADVTEKVATLLSEQGYCVIQTLKEREVREEAVRQVNARCEFGPVLEEFKTGYLGENSSSKVAWLDGDGLQPQLDPYDADFSKVGASLATVAPSFLNTQLSARSFGMVRMPLSKFELDTFKPKSIKSEDTEDRLLDDYMDLCRRSKILMLYVVDDAGEVSLGGNEVKIPLSSNMLILIRADMSYMYKPSSDESIVMQCWLLGEPTGETYDQARDQIMPSQDIPEERYRPKGPRLNVIALMARTCGSVDAGLDVFETMTTSACDCSLNHDRPNRWDQITSDYGPKGEVGKSYVHHGAFKENDYMKDFDNDFFGMSAEECNETYAEVRVYFETGYEALSRAGYTRKTLEGQEIGCYCGTNAGCGDNSGLFMINIQNAMASPEAGKYHMCGVQPGIMISRFSHILNLTGQTVAIDTACSASLTAIALADKDLKLTRADNKNVAMAGGVNVMTVLLPYVFFCGMGALSEKGRSFTFDAHVDGYMRGEGCCQAVMRMCNEQSEELDSLLSMGTIMACLSSSDGKSASLTAPSGPAQQQVMRHSMAMAGITIDEAPGNECHGTGTPLGDPIEMGSVKSLWKKSQTPVGITSRKTFFGHTEANAGIAGICGCLSMLDKCMGIPNLHLREVSGLLDLQGFMTQFWTECTQWQCQNSFVGVNSFGIGGTNARSDLWGRIGQGFEDAPKKRVMLEAYYNTPQESRQDMLAIDPYHLAPKDSLSVGDHLYVVGTWDGRKIPLEMEPQNDDVYKVVVQLGDIRCEQFHILVGPQGLDTQAREAEPLLEKQRALESEAALDDDEEELALVDDVEGQLTEDMADMILDFVGTGMEDYEEYPPGGVGDDLMYQMAIDILPSTVDSPIMTLSPGFLLARPPPKPVEDTSGAGTDDESTDVEEAALSSEDGAMRTTVDESSSIVSKSDLTDEGSYAARMRDLDDMLLSNITVPELDDFVELGTHPDGDLMMNNSVLGAIVDEIFFVEKGEPLGNLPIEIPFYLDNVRQKLDMTTRDSDAVTDHGPKPLMYIYPETAASQMTTHMLGPDVLRKDEGWLLDGKGNSEACYEITLKFNAEEREISWAPLPEPPIDFTSVPFTHQYQVMGAFTRWRHRDLTPTGTPGGYKVSFTLDAEGKAEFKLLRDCDQQQLIYPAEPGLLRGPDAGPGIWYLTGLPGEHVKFEMQLLEAVVIITVTIGSRASEAQIWRS